MTVPSGQSLANERPYTRRRRPLLRPTTTGWIGLSITTLAIISALFSHWLAPFDPVVVNVAGRLAPPLSTDAMGHFHFLGTDQLGRDIFSRIIYGSRISLLIAIAAVPISVLLGVGLGLAAGAVRGPLDDIIMRILDVQLSLPFILLALAVLVAIGPSFSNLVVLIGITGWTQYGRIVRGETLAIRSREFVHAAQALGATQFRQMSKHILPNVASTVVVLVTLQVPHIIILESSLSFLGLGIQPPTPSWGGMLSEGRQYMSLQWWVAVFPGLAITLVVLGGNLLGDWLRDCMDPRRTK